MGEDIRQVEIQGRLVGLVGLRSAFDELARAETQDESEVKAALLELVEAENYVPADMREAYADAIYCAFLRYREGDEVEERGRSGMMWRGIARETIQWHPTVDDGACDGCMKCIDFCAFGVFGFDRESGTVRVESPTACVVGCSLCSTICGPRAISFPPLSYLDDLLKSRR